MDLVDMDYDMEGHRYNWSRDSIGWDTTHLSADSVRCEMNARCTVRMRLNTFLPPDECTLCTADSINGVHFRQN